MASTETNIQLIEVWAYEQIHVPLQVSSVVTSTSFDGSSDAISVDDDALWEWSDYESDPNVYWHYEENGRGNLSVWYEKPIHIIGFKPEKGKGFISKNNDSDLFIFGVKHEL